jgi:hypothetical protein
VNTISMLVPKDVWQVLNKNRSIDKSRYILQGIYVAKDYVASTDGRAAVLISRDVIGIAEDVKIGTYEVIAIGKDSANMVVVTIKEMDAEYPDLQAVMPTTNADKMELYLPNKASAIDITRAVLKLYNYTGNAYSIEFLEKLCPVNETWTVYKATQDKPVLLEVKRGELHFRAVIMPFKV